jgi:hypothetical protein
LATTFASLGKVYKKGEKNIARCSINKNACKGVYIKVGCLIRTGTAYKKHGGKND